MGLHLLNLTETGVTSGSSRLWFFFLAIVICVVFYGLLGLIAIFFVDLLLMSVHELDGARNFGDLIDTTSGEVYRGHGNLFFKWAFLSFFLKGGRWPFYQNWRLFRLSSLLY